MGEWWMEWHEPCTRHQLVCDWNGGCCPVEILSMTARDNGRESAGRTSSEKAMMVDLPPRASTCAFPGPWQAFAAGGLNGLALLHGRRRGQGFVMRVFEEGGPNVGMAGAADIAADVAVRLCACGDRGRYESRKSEQKPYERHRKQDKSKSFEDVVKNS